MLASPNQTKPDFLLVTLYANEVTFGPSPAFHLSTATKRGAPYLSGCNPLDVGGSSASFSLITPTTERSKPRPLPQRSPPRRPSTNTEYHNPMPAGLVRLHNSGQLHFITFSCYDRRPYLNTVREIFEHSLESIRKRYLFLVAGYVVMPEHIHMLVGELEVAPLSKAIQALKLSVTLQCSERPFWQPRYYDFNVFSEKKQKEKLKYIHRNPVSRGLATQPCDWPWSSFNHWSTGAIGTVEIESQWTAARRERAMLPQS
jgi:putative transposase